MEALQLPPKLKKYICANVIGNGLEWYDFAIFGYFAPIFAKQFFPANTIYVSLLSTFAVFGAGFLSRPIGAYIFGKLGDQQGRKKSLVRSMGLMAMSTFLMGLLPTYDMIGIWAPILLALLRILQGISLGGELTGSLSFIVEHSPVERRGFVGAWAYSGGFLGSALGASSGALMALLLTNEQLQVWGWRIPFFLGLGIAFLGYYLRKEMEETPLFLELEQAKAIEKSPFTQVMKEKGGEVLLTIALLMPNTVWIYLLFVFLPTYLSQVMGWTFSQSLLVNVIPSLLLVVLIPFSGYLSDCFGRKRIVLIGNLLLTASAPLAMMITSQGTFWSVMLLQTMCAFFYALSYAPTAALMAEIFPTRIRSTGMGISYHLATGIFGGLTPLILTALTSAEGWVLGPTLWIMFAGFVGLFALSKIRDLSLVKELC